MSFLVLLQEHIYPEGLSVFTGLDKVKPKVKDFSGPTAIFKDLNFYFKIQRLSRCARTLSIENCP